MKLLKAINFISIEEASNKLNQIKYTIMTIMEMITINIKKDYAKQMSLNNINGIKNYSYLKENEFIEKTQNKSDILINNIKSTINNIELYDLYTENIDIINEIINKTVVEYISDIYNNIIIQSLKLKPEFMDEKSDIVIKENQLFSISQNIWEEINKEINDINEYIVTYFNSWLNQKIYKIYYNLYNFRKYFLNSEMNEVLNEYINLFKEITNDMIIESKKIIDENYILANQVLNEQSMNMLILSTLFFKLSFCTGFVNRYYEYKKKFEELLSTFLDKDYLKALKDYFKLLKNEIIEDAKMNMISIDKYKVYFEKYTPIFNLIENINKEILKIIENIENYLNEVNFMNKIEMELINTYQSQINEYNKNKMKKFDDFYQQIYKKTSSPSIMDCDNNEDIVGRLKICNVIIFFFVLNMRLHIYINNASIKIILIKLLQNLIFLIINYLIKLKI